MSCEDQALSPTDVCTNFKCNKVELIKEGKFWICPICKSSYGSNPSPTKN